MRDDLLEMITTAEVSLKPFLDKDAISGRENEAFVETNIMSSSRIQVDR